LSNCRSIIDRRTEKPVEFASARAVIRGLNARLRGSVHRAARSEPGPVAGGALAGQKNNEGTIPVRCGAPRRPWLPGASNWHHEACQPGRASRPRRPPRPPATGPAALASGRPRAARAPPRAQWRQRASGSRSASSRPVRRGISAPGRQRPQWYPPRPLQKPFWAALQRVHRRRMGTNSICSVTRRHTREDRDFTDAPQCRGALEIRKVLPFFKLVY
jgi:hypothetical protein